MHADRRREARLHLHAELLGAGRLRLSRRQRYGDDGRLHLVPGSSSWTQLRTTFTTGPSTTSVTVYTHGWYGQAAYVADDVEVTGPDGGGGTDPGPSIPGAPAGLAVGTTTSSSVALTWNAVSGATGYTVYRDGTKATTSTGTSATVTGLAADTAYQFSVSATNAAGESVKSATVSGRTAKTATGPGPTTSVPKHAVTGYWQNFNNGAAVQKLSDVPADYDIIAVSFADATATPGAVTFNLDSAGLNGYTVAQFKADIKAKQAAGKNVIISVGGEKGAVAVNSDASAAAFADSVYALIQEYGFNGVDIDLENGLNSTYMTKALRSLSSKAGSGLVITMAPQTIDMQSTSGEYFKTALNIKDILTVVNMQYYNSGSMLGCDGKVYSQGSVDFLTALACIQLEGGLAPSQVGLGVPASTRGAGSGYVAPSVVNAALDCLAKGTGCGSFKPSRTYPDLRGAMTWSTNWDATAKQRLVRRGRPARARPPVTRRPLRSSSAAAPRRRCCVRTGVRRRHQGSSRTCWTHSTMNSSPAAPSIPLLSQPLRHSLGVREELSSQSRVRARNGMKNAPRTP